MSNDQNTVAISVDSRTDRAGRYLKVEIQNNTCSKNTDSEK